MQWLWPAVLMLITGIAHYFASAWTARVQVRRQAGEQVSGIDKIARLVRFLCVFLPFGVAALVPDTWIVRPHENQFWFFWWTGLWFMSVLPGVLSYGSPARRAS